MQSPAYAILGVMWPPARPGKNIRSITYVQAIVCSIRRRSVAVDDGGIRFVTLADAGNIAASQRRLYELNRQTALDSPDADGAFPSFDQFEQFVFGASWFRADGQILAADRTR